MTKLTIAIPTYKRPDFLDRCLKTILEQDCSKSINVLVFDDSVSHINVPICEKYQNAGLRLTHHVNDVNLGIDRNVQNAIDSVTTDYLMLLGEDDILLPRSLKIVLDYINKNEFGVLALNYAYLDESQKNITGYAYSQVIGTQLFQTPEFVSEHVYKLGFCGSFVINRRSLSNNPYSVYIGTYFTHLGRILDILNTQKSIDLICHPIAGNRAGGAETFTWKDDAYGVFFGFEKLCNIASERNEFLKKSLCHSIKSYRDANGHLRLKSLIRLRANGLYDMRQYREYIATLDTVQFLEKKAFYILAAVPVALMRLVFKTYSIIYLRPRRVTDV